MGGVRLYCTVLPGGCSGDRNSDRNIDGGDSERGYTHSDDDDDDKSEEYEGGK